MCQKRFKTFGGGRLQAIQSENTKTVVVVGYSVGEGSTMSKVILFW